MICGAGIAGIATAYYLATRFRRRDVLLVDAKAPMSLTTAASGENYRNWWPHGTLVAFIERSIGLLENLARATANSFHMTRRGYLYATRDQNPGGFADHIADVYGKVGAGPIRIHGDGPAGADGWRYVPNDPADWTAALRGVDIVTGRAAIARHFPYLHDDIRAVAHVRRAGDFSTQQLGRHLLSEAKARGVRELRGKLEDVQAHDSGFTLAVRTARGVVAVQADLLVNAAGPFAAQLAARLDVALPLHCVFQQKISFEDRGGAVPRTAPFTVDLDADRLDWSDEERALLAADPATRWLTEAVPGGVHCKPDGRGRWIKLGWAYNHAPADPLWDPAGSDAFPELVLRAAARAIPALRQYYGNMPRPVTHYGGYYARTRDNWPLIGPMGPDGAFMVCGLSGYGTMAACAAGELCATWITGETLPGYARDMSLARYENAGLMAELARLQTDGEL